MSAELLDRVDRAVAVVACRSDDGHGVCVDVVGDPIDIDQGRLGVDGRSAQLDAEEVTRLVEGGVGGLRFDHVGTGDAALLGGMVPVGEHGVGDAARPAGGHQAGRLTVGDGVGVEEVEGHGDDLGLELCGARAHVPLQRVHVGEEPEGVGQEAVVLVVAAVHGARAGARLPRGVLLGGHGRELLEELGPGCARLGEAAVHGEAVGIGKRAHGCSLLAPGSRRSRAVSGFEPA